MYWLGGIHRVGDIVPVGSFCGVESAGEGEVDVVLPGIEVPIPVRTRRSAKSGVSPVDGGSRDRPRCVV